MTTSSGTPFWSGPKRPPAVLQFASDDALHMEYIRAAANMRAFNYGLKVVTVTRTLRLREPQGLPQGTLLSSAGGHSVGNDFCNDFC